jgi:hypothetical protein
MTGKKKQLQHKRIAFDGVSCDGLLEASLRRQF